MTWWIAAFFICACIAPLAIRLPKILWKVLFVIPFALTFAEALTPFTNKYWIPPNNGLSNFFVCIVMGIGFFVSMYAGSYFSKEDSKKFFPLLFLFAGSMLGVLWSDNIFTFFTFWEATGLCSFLLIAFHFKDPETRQSARQALLVNGAGGLALLGALLLLSQNTGTTSLTEIITSPDAVGSDRVLLILLMVFSAITKSAQFPFHFWLPGAMKAPTPASCYLHSATMVKLGAFLLVRFSPLFEGMTLWTVLLCAIGSITSLGALLMSLLRSDLKQLFAWTTVSALGSIFILVGIPYEYSWKAFFSYVLAHSCYKASLFMCVGNIDKQIGTRNIYNITNLIRRMPMTSTAMILSLGSMIGFPFSLGFLGKEYLLTSALLLKGPGALLIVVLVGSGALSIVVAYRLLKLITKRDARPHSEILREAKPTMWIPALCLAATGWILNFFLDEINEYFLMPIVSSILFKGVELKLKVWTGFNAGLVLSIATFLLGGFLSAKFYKYLVHLELWVRFDKPAREQKFLFSKLTKQTTNFLQNGRLTSYLLWIIAPLILWGFVGAFSFYNFDSLFDWQLNSWSLGQLLALAMVLAGLYPLLKSTNTLIQVMGLGLVGYGIGLQFLLADAPDLAMTQIAVETVSLLIFVYCLRFMKSPSTTLPHSYQLLRVIVTGLSFIFALVIATILEKGRIPSRISPYLTENAPTLGRGLNVVNVTLVDFRALDTLGEITVLSIAAIGTYFLFSRVRKTADRFYHSPIIDKATQIFMVLFSIISLYILFRGHNAPGGGFVAGLIYGIAVAFYALVFGEQRASSFILKSPTQWMSIGLLLCFFSGVLSTLLQGTPPLTSLWLSFLPSVGTPLIFDIGVYLVIIGVVTSTAYSFNGRREH
ncbi:hydrogen gas-evolving membrane-bound hydrogenase subunit E [Bdellovibrio sp. HCB209]|uniref:hydrogen gas-evolving membrane-bound hydrogenase subunit E n=1 Tax=Bdellovibrio sp. HCB209 TaxID=3394354 RepID=UPI0039B3E745